MKHSQTMIHRVAAVAVHAWAQPSRAMHSDDAPCTPEQFGGEAVQVYSAVFVELGREVPIEFKQEERTSFSELALHVATQWAASNASKTDLAGPVSAKAFGTSVAAAYSETLVQLRLSLEQQAASADQGSVDA